MVFRRSHVIGSYIFIAACMTTVPVWAADTEVVNGACDAHSYISEGTDPNARKSPFLCDSAVVTFLDDHNSRVMVQFAQSHANNTPILGFSGVMESDNTTLSVQSVYFAPGQKSIADKGFCEFSFQNANMTSIVCGASSNVTGHRTVGLAAFQVAGNGQPPMTSPPPSPSAKAAAPSSQGAIGGAVSADQSMNNTHMDEKQALFQCAYSNAKHYHVQGDVTAVGSMITLCEKERRTYLSACLKNASEDACDTASRLTVADGVIRDK